MQNIHFESAQIHFNFESIMHQSKNFDSLGRKVPHSLAISQSVMRTVINHSHHTHTHSGRLLASSYIMRPTSSYQSVIHLPHALPILSTSIITRRFIGNLQFFATIYITSSPQCYYSCLTKFYASCWNCAHKFFFYQ